MDWIHFVPFVLAVSAATFKERTMEPFTLWMYPGRIYMSGANMPQTILYLTASSENLQSFGFTSRTFRSYIDNSRLA